jgi:hypothetical protein
VKRVECVFYIDGIACRGSSTGLNPNHGFGWPCCVCSYNLVLAKILPGLRPYHWNFRGIAADAFLMTLGLCITGALLEWAMRRRIGVAVLPHTVQPVLRSDKQ